MYIKTCSVTEESGSESNKRIAQRRSPMKKSRKLTLVIGDKSLSSWSMRPWLVLKAANLEFREILISLDRPRTKQEIRRYSPSGRVPVLLHGETAVWDSLAICEYIAEIDPLLWPVDASARAEARSYAAEMHSSFVALRRQLSMDLHLKVRVRHLDADTIA